MGLATLLRRLRVAPRAPAAAPLPAAVAPATVSSPAAPTRAAAPRRVWSPERIAATEELWGQGFLLPGGSAEVLRLALPLGLSRASSLLLLGAGSGGPARTIATSLGAWVQGFEADPDLVALGQKRSKAAKLDKQAGIEPWDPAAPKFRPATFHHAIALEPLRGAPAPEVAAAIRKALRPHGQLVWTELTTGQADLADDPAGQHWMKLEHRLGPPPAPAVIADALRKLGFDLRVAEDMSQHHVKLAIDGWRAAVRSLGAQWTDGARPAPHEAGPLVAEAERWLLRLRLIHAQRLRLMRWHAIAPGQPPA